jgi:hypothetical protein
LIGLIVLSCRTRDAGQSLWYEIWTARAVWRVKAGGTILALHHRFAAPRFAVLVELAFGTRRTIGVCVDLASFQSIGAVGTAQELRSLLAQIAFVVPRF